MTREEWAEAKRGKISASNAHKLLGSQSTKEKYIEQLASEANGAEVLKSGLKYGDKGLGLEPSIIDQFMSDTEVDPDDPPIIRLDIPLIVHPRYNFALCSPDASFIDSNFEKFGLEIKCKFDTPINQEKSWKAIQKKPSRQHAIQCQFSLWCAQEFEIERWVLIYAHIPIETPCEDYDLIRYDLYPDYELHDQFEIAVVEAKEGLQDLTV